ncbi:MAG: LytR C-terminal domain-containing protein [Gemmatimonadota bacterium]|nr:LytR C-terminal domain-containing protein [Gemmatimonadota bacterium]
MDGDLVNLRGCLETGAISLFALILGGFVMSTWLQHQNPSDGPEREDRESVRAPMPPAERARIRVQVLNGSGEPGAAARMTDYLRDRGYDVVEFGNADSFGRSRTVVIDRVGNVRPARDVASSLRGVPIRSEPDSTLILDVTVVVGSDVEEVLAPEADEGPDGRPVWWRWLEAIPGPWR